MARRAALLSRTRSGERYARVDVDEGDDGTTYEER